jgi:hypothetical protein
LLSTLAASAPVPARNVFVHILGEVRDRCGFSPLDYVLMPEPIHPLISEPVKATPSAVIQVRRESQTYPSKNHGGSARKIKTVSKGGLPTLMYQKTW